MLLILDNFEQVVTAGPLVVELLTSTSGLQVIVTSREALHVRGERELPVLPLNVAGPDESRSVERLRQYESVRLFIDRTTAVKPDFAITSRNAPAVADICLRLDGLPLAIELAASRMKYLPAEQLMERLSESLTELKGGARDLPPRQRTLWRTIAWSYNLLSDEEQMLLMMLSIFSGSFDIEAVEAVCDFKEMDVFEGLASLVDKSMLREEEEGGQVRFRMLETIKAFGLSKAEGFGLEAELRRKHAEQYLAMAERAEPELRKADQIAWLARLSLDHENFAACLNWSSGKENFQIGLLITAALGWYWIKKGLITEGWKWYQTFLWSPSILAEKKLRIKALFLGALVRVVPEGLQQARKQLEECIAIAREIGDRDYLACALSFLGALERQSSNLVPMAERESLRRVCWDHSQEGVSLTEEATDPWITSVALTCLYGQAPFPHNVDLSDQKSKLENALVCAKKSGDIWWTAQVYRFIAYRFAEADLGRAMQYCSNSKKVFQELGDKWLSYFSSMQMVGIYMAQSKYSDAARLCRIAMRESLQIGRKPDMSFAGLAKIADIQGDNTKFARLVGILDGREQTGVHSMPNDPDWFPKADDRIKRDPRLRAEWEKGKAMSLDEGIVYALEDET